MDEETNKFQRVYKDKGNGNDTVPAYSKTIEYEQKNRI